MSSEELEQILWDSKSPEEFLAKTDDFLKQAALEDAEIDPLEVVETLYSNDRWDILEMIKDHPVYGERATSELTVHKRMVNWRVEWINKVAKYPDVLRQLHDILIKCEVYTKNDHWPCMADVSYPSTVMQSNGFGDNYFVIMCEGFPEILFKVISFEGAGQFELCRFPIEAVMEPYRHKGIRESRDVKRFCKVGEFKYGDVINNHQLIGTITRTFPSRLDSDVRNS